MKACGGTDVQNHVFFTSALVGGQWSALLLGHFTPRERASLYPLNNRLGEPQSWSGWNQEVKILAPTGTRTPTPQSSSLYQLLYWLPYCNSLIYKSNKKKKRKRLNLLFILSVNRHHFLQKLQHRWVALKLYILCSLSNASWYFSVDTSYPNCQFLIISKSFSFVSGYFWLTPFLL
jgi:hypothetical protein